MGTLYPRWQPESRDSEMGCAIGKAVARIFLSSCLTNGWSCRNKENNANIVQEKL